jgi:chromosome segregation ATPase
LLSPVVKEKREHKERYRRISNDLVNIEAKIATLRRDIAEFEEPLAEKTKLGVEIQRIVAKDPTNLTIKVHKIKEDIKSMTLHEIQQRILAISKGLKDIEEKKSHARERLATTMKERDSLKSKLKFVEDKLKSLEEEDAANIRVKMQALYIAYKDLNATKLTAVQPTGKVERLFQEKLLLSRLINEKNTEIENLSYRISDLTLTGSVLQMEQLILKQREIDENIRLANSEITKIIEDLENFEAERMRTNELLEQIENELKMLENKTDKYIEFSKRIDRFWQRLIAFGKKVWHMVLMKD